MLEQDNKSLTDNSVARKKTSPFFTRDLLIALTIIESLVLLWNMMDHSMPCWDTAAHRLSSLGAYELLKHVHLRTIEWYKHFFTLSVLYPPLFYWLSGFLKLVLGKTAETERLVNLFFVAVLFVSTYRLACVSKFNRKIALLASCFLFLAQSTFWSSHSVLLDCAANATVALGLLNLACWDESPSVKNAICLGGAFGLAILAKNNTIAFFMGPILLTTILALRSKQYFRIGQLACAAGVTFVLVLPWLIFDGPAMLAFVASIQNQSFGTHDRLREFFENLYLYTFEDMPGWVLGPFLTLLFITSIIMTTFKKTWTHSKLFLVSSVVIGDIFCSSFRWLHQGRYIAPMAIPVAILAADIFYQLWQTKNVALRGLLGVTCALAIASALISAFTPYPVQLPHAVDEAICSNHLIANLDWDNMGVSRYPIPPGDWGMLWVLQQIEKESHGQLQMLLVMPNGDAVGDSPLTYLQATNKWHVGLRTCRQYTVAGDIVNFNPKKALELGPWYLLKTGKQGYKFDGPVSQQNYESWCSFIRNSNKVRLVNEKQLPDGSTIQLYKLTASPTLP